NYLALGLWLESDRLGFFLPALTQEKLDIQREVVKEERRQRYDNVPYGTAFERLLRLAYDPGYSYHWPTIGSMDDLTAASLEDIRAFFSTWYRPDNCVLTVAGDFAPPEAKALIEGYFGEIAPGQSFPPFDLIRGETRSERRERFPSRVPLARIYRLYHLPRMGDADWIAGDLLSSVLTSDKASRLEKSLVYEKQIAPTSRPTSCRPRPPGCCCFRRRRKRKWRSKRWSRRSTTNCGASWPAESPRMNLRARRTAPRSTSRIRSKTTTRAPI